MPEASRWTSAVVVIADLPRIGGRGGREIPAAPRRSLFRRRGGSSAQEMRRDQFPTCVDQRTTVFPFRLPATTMKPPLPFPLWLPLPPSMLGGLPPLGRLPPQLE